jgi:type I restriction enzyme S subunit
MTPTDWQETTLGKVGDIITGKTPSIKNPEDWGSCIAFITPTDYGNYRKMALGSIRSLSECGKQRLLNKVLPIKSIMVTCIGSDMGKVALNAIPAVTNQQINSIIPDDKITDSDFLYYELVNKYETLVSYGRSGTAVPILNKGDFSNILITLPSLPEQRAIADVLSSLDAKIDLLHRQNRTLEALAETLFRQWFIEEANPDWEEGTLGELAEVQNGYSFKSSEFSNESDGFEVLKMGHIDKSGGLKSVPKRHYMLKESRLFKYVLQKNDIVMCMTDMKDNVVILGVPAMVDKSDHYVLNQRVARISLRKGSKILSQHILYLFLKDPIFIAELQKKANSGVQVNLTTDAIKNSLILIPPLEKQIKVVSFLDSIYSKFDLNKLQIRKLERLRDALLPKLMAGSVRVGHCGEGETQ